VDIKNMSDDQGLSDIDRLKERLNRGIDYLGQIRPSRFGKVEVDNFYIFLDLVEKYMVGKSSVRINKAITYFKNTDKQKFNVATWFYVLHFARLLRKYLNGDDIAYLSPEQLDNFEFAKELFSREEITTVS